MQLLLAQRIGLDSTRLPACGLRVRACCVSRFPGALWGKFKQSRDLFVWRLAACESKWRSRSAVIHVFIFDLTPAGELCRCITKQGETYTNYAESLNDAYVVKRAKIGVECREHWVLEGAYSYGGGWPPPLQANDGSLPPRSSPCPCCITACYFGSCSHSSLLPNFTTTRCPARQTDRIWSLRSCVVSGLSIHCLRKAQPQTARLFVSKYGYCVLKILPKPQTSRLRIFPTALQLVFVFIFVFLFVISALNWRL